MSNPNSKADDKRRKMERIVDGLQRLYSVAVGLAVMTAIRRVGLDKHQALIPWYVPDTGKYALGESLQNAAPSLLAFLATVVPFYQGMNRHLDRIYVERDVPDSTEYFIVVDFFAFFFESCLLVAFAGTVGTVTAFYVLMIMLGLDVFWGLLAHWVHYRGEISPSTRLWSAINFACILIMVMCFAFAHDDWKPWALCSAAIARTVSDYIICRGFYLPHYETALQAGMSRTQTRIPVDQFRIP